MSMNFKQNSRRSATLIETEIPQRVQSRYLPITFMSERSAFLWGRVRRFAMIIGKLSKMSKDIKQYGSSRSQFFRNQTSESAGVKYDSRYIMHPNSTFKKFWNLVVVVLLLITATIMPYRICFESQTTEGWFIFELAIDMLFVCDIIVNFNSAYYDDNDILVTSRKVITKRYVKSWFFIDLIACIPFQFIETQESDSDQDYNKLIRLLRIPRLYRLLRIIRLVKMIRVFRSQAFVNKIIGHLKMTGGIVRLVKFVFTILIIVHLVGCLWYYLATIEEYDIDTWLHRYSMLDKTNTEIYLASIYFVFSTLTTVGYGDISAYTNLEKTFAILLMGFGAGFYSYMIGNLSNIMAMMDLRNHKLRNRMSSLNEFDKACKLPEDLMNRIKRFLEDNYTNNIYNVFDLNLFIKEIPSSLRVEVSEHLYSKVTDKIIFFKDKTPSLKSFVIPLLRIIKHNFREYVYYEDDIAEEVYFIIQGRVNMLASNSVAFRTYVQGSYFGELEILNRAYRDSSVQVSSREADFYILSKENFLDMMEEFKEVADEIKDVAKVRKMKHDEAKNHVLGLQPVHSVVPSRMSEDDDLASDPSYEEDEDHDEFVRRRKQRNNTIWAEAIRVDSPRKKDKVDYEQFIQTKQRVMTRHLTINFKRQKTMKLWDKEYVRIKPKQMFKEPILPARNSAEPSDSESILADEEDEAIETSDNKEDLPRNVQFQNRLLSFEEKLADNTMNINSIKSAQASLTASLQELINCKFK